MHRLDNIAFSGDPWVSIQGQWQHLSSPFPLLSRPVRIGRTAPWGRLYYYTTALKKTQAFLCKISSDLEKEQDITRDIGGYRQRKKRSAGI